MSAHNGNAKGLRPIPKILCPCYVLILGRGLGGLAAAIALVMIGRSVTVLEAQPEFREVSLVSYLDLRKYI